MKTYRLLFIFDFLITVKSFSSLSLTQRRGHFVKQCSYRSPPTFTFCIDTWIRTTSTSTTTNIHSTASTEIAEVSSSSSGHALNPLVTSVKMSATVAIFSLVKQMEAEGQTVTSLCVGEPDFLPPPAVLQAASHAILSGDTKYTAVTGTIPLRKAITHDLHIRKQTLYKPDEIIVSNGAKQAVYQGILATCGLHDAVIIPAPYWPSYPEMVTLVGGHPIILQTQEKDGYLITPQALRSCLEQAKTQGLHVKLLILCNPSNPTGGVHTRQHLEQLAQVLEEYPQVYILADEIYERLVYADSTQEEHVSFASLSPAMFARTMTVNGFSKSHAMTGMRLGYMAAPSPIAKAVATIQSQLTSCAGSVSQAAGLAALTLVTEEEMKQNVHIMRQKRDYVIQRLQQIPHVHLAVPPNGAFYVLPDVSYYYKGNDEQLCLDLLKSHRLAIVPGSSFGAPGTVRISYATSIEELKIAMDKLQDFLRLENIDSSLTCPPPLLAQ